MLSVYIENVLGQRESPPINQPVEANQPPTIGYPLTVRDDGTLSLPLVQPINVRGRTLPEIEQLLRQAYIVNRRLLKYGRDRILVSLHLPRQARVLVVREESEDDFLSGVSIGGGDIGRSRRGRSEVVSLPAYQNDVLHALVESGGLPGLDADNVVYVIRAQRGGRPLACQTPAAPPLYRPRPAPQLHPSPPPGYGPASNGAPIGYGAPRMPMQQPTQPQPMQGGRIPTSVPGDSPVARPYSANMPPSMIRGQSPDGSMPLRSGPNLIQRTSAWLMATPRQVAEQVTGIPMPPKAVDAPTETPASPQQVTPLQYSTQS